MFTGRGSSRIHADLFALRVRTSEQTRVALRERPAAPQARGEGRTVEKKSVAYFDTTLFFSTVRPSPSLAPPGCRSPSAFIRVIRVP